MVKVKDLLAVFNARYQEVMTCDAGNPVLKELNTILSSTIDDREKLANAAIWYMQRLPVFATNRIVDFAAIFTDPLTNDLTLLEAVLACPEIDIKHYATQSVIDILADHITPRHIRSTDRITIVRCICAMIKKNPNNFIALNFDEIMRRHPDILPLNSKKLTELEKDLSEVLKVIAKKKSEAIADSRFKDVWINKNSATLSSNLADPGKLKEFITNSKHTFTITELESDIKALTTDQNAQCRLFLLFIGYGTFSNTKLTTLPDFINPKTLSHVIGDKAIQGEIATYLHSALTHLRHVKDDKGCVLINMLPKLAIPLQNRKEIFNYFADQAFKRELLESFVKDGKSSRAEYITYLSTGTCDYFRLVGSFFDEAAYANIKALSDHLPLFELSFAQVRDLSESKGLIKDSLDAAFKEKFNASNASFDEKIEALLLLADALATDEKGNPANPLSQIIIYSRGPIALTRRGYESDLESAVKSLRKTHGTEFAKWVTSRTDERATLVCKEYAKTQPAQSGMLSFSRSSATSQSSSQNPSNGGGGGGDASGTQNKGIRDRDL